MYPASFIKSIKDKIIPDVMEELYKLRTQFEYKIEEVTLQLEAIQEVVKDLGEDQHPPAIDLEEWKQMKADMRAIRNKKAFKKLGK